MTLKDLRASFQTRLNNLLFWPDPDAAERAYFYSEYPRWWNFLGGHFPLAEFDMASEEEVVEAVFGPEPDTELLEEGTKILADPNFPWREIMDASNTSFKDAADVRQWLTHLIDLIKKQTNEVESNT